jgi:hypothetical protein
MGSFCNGRVLNSEGKSFAVDSDFGRADCFVFGLLQFGRWIETATSVESVSEIQTSSAFTSNL